MTRTRDIVDVNRVAFDRLKAVDVMRREVQVAHAETKADVIASMMIEGFGGVPIVNDRHHLVGSSPSSISWPNWTRGENSPTSKPGPL